MAGWIGQGLLLLVGAVLGVFAARRSGFRLVRAGTRLLGPASAALFVVTTAVAVGSY